MIDAHSGYPTDASGYMHQVRCACAQSLGWSLAVLASHASLQGQS